MEVPDQLLNVFSGQLQETDGRYVVEIPTREVELGEVNVGGTYRVALLAQPAVKDEETDTVETDHEDKHGHKQPPVEEGEQREVDIETIGEQGDGIARVERGYVVIVPDTKEGERVTVEISEVKANVAFAEVVTRQTHF